MSSIQEIISSEFITGVSLPKINTNFEALNTDKLEASDIAGKQNTLVSGSNIKTVNGATILGSGDLTIPTLTDGDKGDLTLSSSGSVWTIDNDVVSNAKLANVASGTFKGRTTVGTGDPEDLTGTQATVLLDLATTSVKGLMSPSDKTALNASIQGKSTGALALPLPTNVTVTNTTNYGTATSITGGLFFCNYNVLAQGVDQTVYATLQWSSDNVTYVDIVSVSAFAYFANSFVESKNILTGVILPAGYARTKLESIGTSVSGPQTMTGYINYQ